MTQGSIPRPRTQKNPRPRTDFPMTDPLEAKDRNAQGQGPSIQRARKKVFAPKNCKLSRNFRHSQGQGLQNVSSRTPPYAVKNS